MYFKALLIYFNSYLLTEIFLKDVKNKWNN